MNSINILLKIKKLRNSKINPIWIGDLMGFLNFKELENFGFIKMNVIKFIMVWYIVIIKLQSDISTEFIVTLKKCYLSSSCFDL